MSLEVHASSVENLYVPVRNEHPTTGPINLSSFGVEVALPVVGASPSTWVTAAWASGSLRRGDDRYYVATVALSAFTLSAGTTYQPWVRVGGGSGSITKAPLTLKAVNA